MTSPSENSTPPKEPSVLIAWAAQANPNILLCHLPGETPGPTHRVRVRNNTNFVRGMEVPVRHISADYFECAAPSMPRHRGKW
jgi:hypothetical protein